MRILHTSDWHIGKRLNGRDRLCEQRAVLDEIVEICDREGVELVLVAGDVFDTFLPSAEAEDLFYGSVKKMAGKDRCVLVISGNHDDNVRLTAATALSEEQGIYIYGNAEHTPKLCSGRALAAVEAGAHHMVFRNGAGDAVFVNVLPYPNEARFKEDKIEGETFYDKMHRWILAGEESNTQKFPSVFLSHLFIAGGKVSEGEREIDLGGARAVPLELLPGSCYTALGHLHKRQHFKNNVYYSGSILQYAFDEAGAKKSVIVFDLNEEGAQNIREIPLGQIGADEHSGCGRTSESVSRLLCRVDAVSFRTACFLAGARAERGQRRAREHHTRDPRGKRAGPGRVFAQADGGIGTLLRIL